jgi:hypothetical protein
MKSRPASLFKLPCEFAVNNMPSLVFLARNFSWRMGFDTFSVYKVIESFLDRLCVQAILNIVPRERSSGPRKYHFHTNHELFFLFRIRASISLSLLLLEYLYKTISFPSDLIGFYCLIHAILYIRLPPPPPYKSKKGQMLRLQETDTMPISLTVSSALRETWELSRKRAFWHLTGLRAWVPEVARYGLPLSQPWERGSVLVRY